VAPERIVAALDIGTSEVVALVGEMDADGRVYVIGHGLAPMIGLRKGIVVDMEQTVTSIERAIKDAALVSGTEIDRVTVGISGEHIRSINSNGVVAVNRTANEITAADVKRVLAAASTVAIPVDREIIHVIPQQYAVDDQNGVRDPIGMSGLRLEVEAHIVTSSLTSSRNIVRALERCRLDVDHIVLESVAQSQLALTPTEMEMGVVLIDIGGDITNVAIFVDGAIRHTAVVPLGGKHVTSDIAIAFRTPLDQAENMKLMYGAALDHLADISESITVIGASGRAIREVPRGTLVQIIRARLEEILSLVMREIRQAGLEEFLTGGVVLSGGGSLTPGTAELAEQLFDLPARLAEFNGIDHTPDELDNCRYATAHGLLMYGLLNEPKHSVHANAPRKFFEKVESMVLRIFW
jgi:cell division protein FtsA